MREEIRRQALARVLAAFLPNLGLDGLRVVEQVATRMLLQQQRHGELDLSVPLDVSRFGIDPVSSAVFAICAELGAEECRRAELHERARAEMFAAPDDDPSDAVIVDGFELDQHRTLLDPTPAVIALCEQPRDRDEELEVDLQFDISDVDEPIGVHAVGGAELGDGGGE